MKNLQIIFEAHISNNVVGRIILRFINNYYSLGYSNQLDKQLVLIQPLEIFKAPSKIERKKAHSCQSKRYLIGGKDEKELLTFFKKNLLI